MERPERSIVVAAFATAGAALVAFGVAHMLLITPVVDRSADTSLALRLLQMFGVPVLVGIPFAAAVAYAGAWAWQATRPAGRLRSWRFGAALATSFLPAILVVSAVGAQGDAPPRGLVPALFAAAAIGPGLVGGWAAGSRGTLLLPIAALPFALPWTIFLVGEGFAGWVAAFVCVSLGIVVAGGALMERLAARFSGKAGFARPDL